MEKVFWIDPYQHTIKTKVIDINDNEILLEKDRYQQIGEEARLKVLKVFNRQKMIDSLLQSYSEILEKSGRQNQLRNQREASQKKGSKTSKTPPETEL
mgnify:CR=1 FL=1